ncbi:MAG: DegT/DnrJ/EryC1/StrS family aminotransferase [Candidatus Omnitrophica bacterium]|nr:DegT/DnrJ/EryC1/StrS family aminotransferase [Candidatus Omnitrophota bacterium]
MSIFREIPPTAGFPLHIKDLLSPFFDKHRRLLEEDFKDYFNFSFSSTTYSGTAAFYFILEALKRISSKKSVVIPAFICPLIPLAIARAGLKVIVCDIQKDNFNFDLIRLQKLCTENTDIAAIVAVHLAGIPLNIDAIKELIKDKEISIIEDCAQAQGATYHRQKVGTLGEFSFFSLCRGKGLTIYEGGILASKIQGYRELLKDTVFIFGKNNYFSEGLKIIELFGYWIFYRPLLFWFIFSFPQKFWEMLGNKEKAMIEYFDTNFPIHNVSKFRRAVGHSCFKEIEKKTLQQRAIALRYIEKLGARGDIKIITEPYDTQASYPFLAIIFSNPEKCIAAKKEFNDSGLGASQIYLSAITEYDYLKNIIEETPCPNAKLIAKNHITLSTSLFLTDRDINVITDKLISVLER